MTQQYLAGELSLLLAQLPAVATSRGALGAAVNLRHRAETVPVSTLSLVVLRALELADGLCWESLQRGDLAAFTRQATLAAEIHEFGVCASLIPEG